MRLEAWQRHLDSICKHKRILRISDIKPADCVLVRSPPGSGNFATFVHKIVWCKDCGALGYACCNRDSTTPGATKRFRWHKPKDSEYLRKQ